MGQAEFKTVEHALGFMRDKSEGHAKAKANRVYLEQFRKSKKAMLMIEAEQKGKKTGQEREAYAYAHAEYAELLDGLRVAVEQEETYKFQLKAAEARIEIWRTQQANQRSEYRAGSLVS
tara:strand:- start:352 stop:708 length:357 start_codon:yes stop_codon:yes gene_type:complete